MWCPRCNRHYDDEFDTCLICGGKLEDYTPILSQEERDVLDLQQEDVAKELVKEAPPAEIMPELLVSVVGEEEARRLAALLEGVRIPCLCRPSRDNEPVVEPEIYETAEYEADEDELAEEALTPPQEDETIYDLLIPKMLFPKALRVLNEDSVRQQETLVEEDMLPEFEEEETAEKQSDETDGAEQPEKKRKGFFGFFGKKR